MKVAFSWVASFEDLALTVLLHPTLLETLEFSAEMIDGSITDLFLRKR